MSDLPIQFLNVARNEQRSFSDSVPIYCQNRQRDSLWQRLLERVEGLRQEEQGIRRDRQSADHFQCGICLDKMNKPVTLSCAHNFCQCCTTEWLVAARFRGATCPSCRQPIESVNPSYEISSFLAAAPINNEERARRISQDEILQKRREEGYDVLTNWPWRIRHRDILEEHPNFTDRMNLNAAVRLASGMTQRLGSLRDRLGMHEDENTRPPRDLQTRPPPSFPVRAARRSQSTGREAAPAVRIGGLVASIEPEEAHQRQRRAHQQRAVSQPGPSRGNTRVAASQPGTSRGNTNSQPGTSRDQQPGPSRRRRNTPSIRNRPVWRY